MKPIAKLRDAAAWAADQPINPLKAIRLLNDKAAERRWRSVPRIELDLERRLSLVQRYGDFSLAYSTAVQPVLSYFGDTDGYIAFAAKAGSLIALGEPVAQRERRHELIRQFVERSRPCFADISLETAALLAGMGYKISQIGIETELDVQTHDFSAPNMKKVRYAARWLHNNGFSIVNEEDAPEARDAIHDLSRQWRESRIVNRRETSFLNRPFTGEPEPLTRRKLLRHADGRFVAMMYFDPIFRDGKVIGYLTAFKRKLPGASPYTELGMTKLAVDKFREEGIITLMLGLSPLARHGPSGFSESAALRGLMDRMYRSAYVNENIFNLQGHAAFKRRFHGIETPRFFASGSGSPVIHGLNLLRLSRFV